MAHIQPIRALVVEDNPGDATLTRHFLAESFGSRVQTSCVEWLRDAVRCLEHQTFDVVILDLVLPDAEGLEAAADQRRRSSGPCGYPERA